MMRPTTSGVPPAAKGTTTRTGLAGYCAKASVAAHGSDNAPASAARPIQRKPRRMRSSLRWTRRSTRLDARQQLERGLAFDGPQIGVRKCPRGDALVGRGAVAEGEVGPVHHLGHRHHLEQRGDLARRIALRELVIELLELGEGTIGQVRGLALLGEADEARG